MKTSKAGWFLFTTFIVNGVMMVAMVFLEDSREMQVGWAVLLVAYGAFVWQGITAENRGRVEEKRHDDLVRLLKKIAGEDAGHAT